MLRDGYGPELAKTRAERHLVDNHKLACLGLLVSSITHETCNLNNSIIFNIPILKEYLEKMVILVDNYVKNPKSLQLCGMPYSDFRSELFAILHSIEHASNRILENASGLKDFARINCAQKQNWVEVEKVIEKAVSICRGELKKTVRSLVLKIADDLPLILIDSLALEQVLVNILINAAQAADKQASTVTIKAKIGNLRCDHLIIEVADNGSGMDEETKMKIFDPFFTTKGESKGIGLGLYVSKNQIDALGGHIEVESEIGKGSTFRIILKC